MSYKSFLRHVHEVQQCNLFKQWSVGSRDALGNASTPLQILVLGALRYLGRAITFDELEEHTGVSEETHRKFFHVYIEFGSTIFYDKYVRIPSDDDIESSSREYLVAGLPGKFVICQRIYIIVAICSRTAEICIWILTIKFSVFFLQIFPPPDQPCASTPPLCQLLPLF